MSGCQVPRLSRGSQLRPLLQDIVIFSNAEVGLMSAPKGVATGSLDPFTRFDKY